MFLIFWHKHFLLVLTALFILVAVSCAKRDSPFILPAPFNSEPIIPDNIKNGEAKSEGKVPNSAPIPQTLPKEEEPKEESHPADYVSIDTIASVVDLYYFVKTYELSNVDHDYKISYKAGRLYAGEGATITKEANSIVHIGSGVIISPSGTILSNAHVTCSYPSVERLPMKKAIVKVPALCDAIFIAKSMDTSGIIYCEESIKSRPAEYDARVMYVGVADKAAIQKNDTQTHLKYAAAVTIDDKIDKNDSVNNDSIYVKDRALLQIFAQLDSTISEGDYDGRTELKLLGEVASELRLPYAKLANPFDISYTDNKVCALGFPGVGDKYRVARTTGNFLGYSSDRQSEILHTTFISYGNSGGGLFYNDYLIGINTWFTSSRDEYHPVSVAQPITYWQEFFVLNNSTSGLVPQSWIKSDPAIGGHKDECALILRLDKSEEDNPADYHYYIYQKSNFDAPLFFKEVGFFKNCETAISLLRADKKRYEIKQGKQRSTYYDFYDDDVGQWTPDYSAIAQKTGIKESDLVILKKNIIEDEYSLADLLRSELKELYKVYKDGSFKYADIPSYNLNVLAKKSSGKYAGDAVFAAPKGKTIEIALQKSGEREPRKYQTIVLGQENKKIVTITVLDDKGENNAE